jgi:transporter family protein
MRVEYPVYVLAGLVIVLWGLWGFFGKVALSRQMPPLSVFYVEVVIGFVIAAAVLGAVVAWKQPAPWQQPWNWFGVLSGAAMACGLLLYYLALEHGPASIVVPLTAAYPLVTVLLSLTLLLERLTVVQWAGVSFVVAGVILLLTGSANP